MKVYFTDYFDVDPDALERYGAFNISLLNDLPLFIDPFLLFASKKPKYRQLHDKIITYLKFLRDKSLQGTPDNGLIGGWYRFPEVRQLWLGFCKRGNSGSGLGLSFATALDENLHKVFSSFGNERITEGTHLEKVCLVADRVGRDCVSDFAANLIKPFLCEYTQTFALAHVAPEKRRRVAVPKALFDYDLECWLPLEYELPFFDDYVLLTPSDILSKDENWINRSDLVSGLERITLAMPDGHLRAQLNNYLSVRLKEDMSDTDRKKIFTRAIREFPEVIEHYILQKEQGKDEAIRQSQRKVGESVEFYVHAFRAFVEQVARETDFYRYGMDTLEEARARVNYLKRVIENNGGYRLFYHKNRAVQREQDLQILFRFTWYATESDFNSEVNNGRGPVDFKVSRGRRDSSLVEFKLAKNTKLEQNLRNQLETYKKSNGTEKELTVIFYFSSQELARVQSILKTLSRENDNNIILIDVRNDNKPSASNA